MSRTLLPDCITHLLAARLHPFDPRHCQLLLLLPLPLLLFATSLFLSTKASSSHLLFALQRLLAPLAHPPHRLLLLLLLCL
jgi:hypothetical protein